VASSSFKRVSYTEAIEILEGVVASGKKKFEYPVSWGIDLQVGANGWAQLSSWVGVRKRWSCDSASVFRHSHPLAMKFWVLVITHAFCARARAVCRASTSGT